MPQHAGIVQVEVQLLAAEVSKTRETVTLGEARRAIEAAERRAEEIGQPEDIAVVDAGGIPLVRDGEIVGAVGVSSGSVEQDQEVAQMGAAAL